MVCEKVDMFYDCDEKLRPDDSYYDSFTTFPTYLVVVEVRIQYVCYHHDDVVSGLTQM